MLTFGKTNITMNTYHIISSKVLDFSTINSIISEQKKIQLSEESILFSEIVKNDTTIYLALDSDAKKKAERMIRLFLKYDIEIYVIDIEQTVHEDVGEMSKEEFETLKTKAEKLDAEKFLINRILKM